MFRSYLKLALRSLAKDKVRASIEVVGLAIGLASCLLILLFVRHEWSFDRFHSRADDIYRAWVREDYGNGEVYFNSVTPVVLAPTFGDAYPEIEHYVRIGTFGDVVQRGDTKAMETIHLVDPAFFDVFDFPLLAGDRSTALDNANTVVITESTARRYFGEGEALGRTLSIRTGGVFHDFLVTGVAADPPSNSSIQFEIAVPFQTAHDLWPEPFFQHWFNVTVETYFELDPQTDVAAFKAKFPTLLDQVLGDEYERSHYTVGLQPITDIHLDPSIPTGIAPVSNPAYSYILATIAFLILLVACINYMTLSIGRSAHRAVEVGIRKSIGADRGTIVRQFWGEALLTTFLALVLGVILAEAFRPLFNALAATQLEPAIDATTILTVLGLTILVGLVAGGYPSLILSRFRPVEILKGKVRTESDRGLIRRGLVVIQFGCSVFLITSTLMIVRQLNFLDSKPLGFQKDHLVVVPTSITPDQNKRISEVIDEGIQVGTLLRAELASNPGIIGMTAAGHRFGESWTKVGYESDQGDVHNFMFNVVDEDYIDVLGLKLVAGRGFSRDIPSDKDRALVVNEAFVREHGFDSAVGKQLLSSRFPDHEIIGVVKDFNYESLHGEIQPLVLALGARTVLTGANNVSIETFPMPKMIVRIRADDVPATLASIGAAWKRVAPDQEYSYTFVDETIDAQYKNEQRLSTLVSISAVLAVVIACLGLFGLAGLAVVRRTKEIGIRKVLGASIPNVFWLLAKDFVLLVVVSCLIATPLAYLVMQDWLEGFAYRAATSPDPFILSALLALAVAMIAVSYHGLRASTADPVVGLRYE